MFRKKEKKDYSVSKYESIVFIVNREFCLWLERKLNAVITTMVTKIFGSLCGALFIDCVQ